MERKSGVLMHISTLWGDYSCGSFGKAANEFVDFLSDCGFTYWQVLPFCPADDYNSPYKSYSTFAGNPYFVDLEQLLQEGLIFENELTTAKQNTPYLCEFERLREERLELLFKASQRVKNAEEIEKFISGSPYILDFCEFMALKTANGQKPWWEWDCDKTDETILFGWKFVQFKFFEQWSKIKAYANQKGIKIIGDIPFYVAMDSSDVRKNTDQFMIDEKNIPYAVAGVPPDYFCEDGQLWGNPLYNWEEMRKTGYRWWSDRMSAMLKLFDGVRVDHFRAIESFWSVPYGEETARNGKWVKGPGMELISKIKELAKNKLIIAEDLGDITDEVNALVDESGFPGMRVVQFGFLGGESTHKPHNYKNNCVAYSGTHDNNTLLGYLWELSEDLRREMLEYCGYTDNDWNKGFDSMLRTLWQSAAGLVIVPIQDLLGYGADTRLNTPGRADGNWQFRITRDQLEKIDKEKFRRLNSLYYR
ncbi:MAG: 4-alpha-glucanotransferase [Ruminococcaceae bacterium]|nr:4-alpha-glucanotransferase [Oscillospiraceae bacterium]